MMLKLKGLKVKLKNWNLSVFEDVNRNVAMDQQKLERIQTELQHNDFSLELQNIEARAIFDVSRALRI